MWNTNWGKLKGDGGCSRPLIYFSEIPWGNPKFWLFQMVDKPFFNPRGDLDLPVFPCDRQKESFFVNFTLFLPNVMTLFSKNKRRDLIDHIFRNPIEINT